MAVQEGHFPVIEQLIDYGADVNARDNNGLTCLHFIIMCRDYFDIPSEACPQIKKVWYCMDRRFCLEKNFLSKDAAAMAKNNFRNENIIIIFYPDDHYPLYPSLIAAAIDSRTY